MGSLPDHTRLIPRLCNINERWWWHRSDTRFGHNVLCHVTYLPISPKGMPRFELSYHGNLHQTVEFKIVRKEKNDYVSNPPVELAHWFKCMRQLITGSYDNPIRQCMNVWQGFSLLVHFPLDKMVALSQTILSDAFSWMKSFVFKKKSLEFVAKGPIDNNPAFVKIGAEWLSKTMVYMCMLMTCLLW